MFKKIPKMLIRAAIKEESPHDRNISYSKEVFLNIVNEYANDHHEIGEASFKILEWDRLYIFLRNQNEIPIIEGILDGLMKTIPFDDLDTNEEKFGKILNTLYCNGFYWWKYDKDTESYVHIDCLQTYERIYRTKILFYLKQTYKQLNLDLIVGAKIPSEMNLDERKIALKTMRQLTYKIPDILKTKKEKGTIIKGYENKDVKNK